MFHKLAFSLAWMLSGYAANPTAELLSELIRVDTSNPPGNEAKIDELLAAKLRPLGFQIDLIPTPVAGKSVMFARLYALVAATISALALAGIAALLLR